MALYLRFTKSWADLGLNKHHVFVPPEITSKTLVQSRRLICKSRLDSKCDYWDEEGDYRDDADQACKTCSRPKFSNSEFSEMLWGENQAGLIVDTASLRRYLRGHPMKFDRYREVIRSLYSLGHLREDLAVVEWNQLNEMEAFANLLVNAERKLRTNVSDHLSFLMGYSAPRLTIFLLFRSCFGRLSKVDEMRRLVFSARAFADELEKVRIRQQARVEASNRQIELARLAGTMR